MFIDAKPKQTRDPYHGGVTLTASEDRPAQVAEAANLWSVSHGMQLETLTTRAEASSVQRYTYTVAKGKYMEVIVSLAKWSSYHVDLNVRS